MKVEIAFSVKACGHEIPQTAVFVKSLSKTFLLLTKKCSNDRIYVSERMV